MKKIADDYTKNTILGLVNGQAEKTIQDLIDSGVTNTEDIEKALSKKEKQFKDFLVDKIGPDLEKFVDNALNNISQKDVEKILNDGGKAIIDEFTDKYKDELSKVKKEYQKIYGLVEDAKDIGYDDVAWFAISDLWNKKLKNKAKQKAKETINKVSELVSNDSVGILPEAVIQSDTGMWLFQNLAGIFSQGFDWEWTPYDGISGKVGDASALNDKIERMLKSLEEPAEEPVEQLSKKSEIKNRITRALKNSLKYGYDRI